MKHIKTYEDLNTQVINDEFIRLIQDGVGRNPNSYIRKNRNTKKIIDLLDTGLITQISLDEALLYMSCENDQNLTKILIDAGADVNADNNGDYSPLMWTCYNADYNNTKLLIDKGADIHFRDIRWGDTSITVIPNSSLYNDKKENNYIKILDLLISLGADITSKNNRGLELYDNILSLYYAYSKLKEWFENKFPEYKTKYPIPDIGEYVILDYHIHSYDALKFDINHTVFEIIKFKDNYIYGKPVSPDWNHTDETIIFDKRDIIKISKDKDELEKIVEFKKNANKYNL